MDNRQVTATRLAQLTGCRLQTAQRWLRGGCIQKRYFEDLTGVHKWLKAVKGKSARRCERCHAIRRAYNLDVSMLAAFYEVEKSSIYNWEQNGLPSQRSISSLENISRLKQVQCDIKTLRTLVSYKGKNIDAA